MQSRGFHSVDAVSGFDDGKAEVAELGEQQAT
jgi:hypothetical protein